MMCEHRLSDMHELHRVFAYYVHSQEVARRSIEEQLEHPDRVADDISARNLPVLRLAYLVGHFRGGQLLLVRPTKEISGIV